MEEPSGILESFPMKYLGSVYIGPLIGNKYSRLTSALMRFIVIEFVLLTKTFFDVTSVLLPIIISNCVSVRFMLALVCISLLVSLKLYSRL